MSAAPEKPSFGNQNLMGNLDYQAPLNFGMQAQNQPIRGRAAMGAMSYIDRCKGGLFSSNKPTMNTDLFSSKKSEKKNTGVGFFGGKSDSEETENKFKGALPHTSNPWLTLLEKQKLEGCWEMNEMNSNLLCKDLEKIKASMPESYNQNGKNEASSLWMTCLVLFFLETFQNEKIGSWRLIWKKGEQWMQSKGFNYQILKEIAKKFFYGVSAKNIHQIPLIKQCKCGNELIFVKSIPAYKGDYFGCDQCSANNFIEGGVYHCESCQFDLCEECNNEQPIICNTCGKGSLKWMTQIPQTEYNTYYWCDVCTKQNEIQNGVYHCSGCGKFDLCGMCKSKL